MIQLYFYIARFGPFGDQVDQRSNFGALNFEKFNLNSGNFLNFLSSDSSHLFPEHPESRVQTSRIQSPGTRIQIPGSREWFPSRIFDWRNNNESQELNLYINIINVSVSLCDIDDHKKWKGG